MAYKHRSYDSSIYLQRCSILNNLRDSACCHSHVPTAAGPSLLRRAGHGLLRRPPCRVHCTLCVHSESDESESIHGDVYSEHTEVYWSMCDCRRFESWSTAPVARSEIGILSCLSALLVRGLFVSDHCWAHASASPRKSSLCSRCEPNALATAELPCTHDNSGIRTHLNPLSGVANIICDNHFAPL